MRQRSRRNSSRRNRRRGGFFDGLSAAATSAVLPFGLLYAQKAFQKSRRVSSLPNIYRKFRKTHRFK